MDDTNTLQTPQQQEEEEEDDERGPLLPPQPQNPNQDENLTCEICTEPIPPPNKKFKNENLCKHPLCTDCIIKYITVALEEHEVARIPCLALDCTHSLDTISCRTILSEQLFIKWCDMLCESTLLDLDTCHFPYENCAAMVINECGGNVNKSKCPNCEKLFCFKCKLPWHAGFRCEERSENRDPNDFR